MTDHVQLLLDNMEEAVLTQEEKDFCWHYVNDRNDDGQRLHAWEVAMKVSKSRTKHSAKVRASRILNGGDKRIKEETRHKKKIAINAYIDRLESERMVRLRQDMALTEQEIIAKARRVYDLSIGDAETNISVNTKFGPFNTQGYVTNPSAAKGAIELLAKMGGFMVEKKEVTGKDGKPLVLEPRRVEYIATDGSVIEDD